MKILLVAFVLRGALFFVAAQLARENRISINPVRMLGDQNAKIHPVNRTEKGVNLELRFGSYSEFPLPVSRPLGSAFL